MNQTGRSMIEMLGVLAIVGVLSVGGISGYTKAMFNYRTNSTVETMLSIAANIKTISLRMKDYTGIAKAAIKLKAVPPEVATLDPSTKEPVFNTNAFGGTIDINAFATESGKAPRAFYVAMNGLPKDACINIASQNFGNALIYAGVDTADKGFVPGNISLDSDHKNLKTAAPYCSVNYCLKQQMTPTQAAAACNCASGTCHVALIMF